jgi:hypothetical protein
VAHTHTGLEEAALELEAPPKLDVVGLHLGKVVKRFESEGGDAGVGDRCLEDKSGKVLDG